MTNESLIAVVSEHQVIDAETPDCIFYMDIFGDLAKKLKEDDPSLSDAYSLLCRICSYHLRLDTPDDPFGPLGEFSGGRTALPEDLSDLELEAIGAAVKHVADADLSARLNDVLWFRRKEYQRAESASRAYVKSALRLRSDGSRFAVDKLERAIQLASQLGRHRSFFAEILREVEDAFLAVQNGDIHFLSPMLEILLKHSSERRDELVSHAMSEIGKAPVGLNPQTATRSILDSAAGYYDALRKQDEARDCRIRIAETWELDAENALKRPHPSNFVAASFLAKAIHMRRQTNASEEKLKALHVRLRSFQERADEEMGTISTGPVDITSAVQKSRELVAGKTFPEALSILAHGAKPINFKRIQADAPRSLMEHATSFTIGSTQKIAHTGYDSSLSPDVARYCDIQRQINVSMIIEPIREQILAEHGPRMADFVPVVANNPLIAPGREEIWASGLNHGLQGRFLEAVHLLIPQLEHSIRFVMNNRGQITSSIEQSGVQKEWDLNVLLRRQEVVSFFGEDLIRDFCTLLVDAAAGNFRNEMSHGMLEFDRFRTRLPAYIWWLHLHYVFLPIWLAELHSSTNDEVKEV